MHLALHQERCGADYGCRCHHPHALLVHALVAQLRVTLQAIADVDKAIAQHAQDQPDFPLFDTFRCLRQTFVEWAAESTRHSFRA